eukprot:Seg709.1 transcript_id=Seg709.1/GoldUCD/mRNA.D3Y31 product="hypothetical protein" protein_id=Seg709.1/GoldUCD/D3Y31
MVDVTIDEDAADPIEIGNKPKFGKRMDAAIMRNMLHHKMMAEEVETLEMAKKRAATDMKERMTNFALKQHKNGISTGTEKIDVQKARQRNECQMLIINVPCFMILFSMIIMIITSILHREHCLSDHNQGTKILSPKVCSTIYRHFLMQANRHKTKSWTVS